MTNKSDTQVRHSAPGGVAPQRRKLHIAFCVNDAYVPYLCVALKGIAVNHTGKFDIDVHIVTDSITPTHRRHIEQAMERADNSVTCIVHEVDDAPVQDLYASHYSKYSWYRLLLPDLLHDIHSVLYIDTDVAINSDLTDILEFDIDDNTAIATAPDTDSFIDEPFERCGYPRDLGYVCTGVMLINLDYWRRHSIADKVCDWGRANESSLKYPDQDSINYVCRHNKAYLPLRYGVTKSLFTQPYFYTPELRAEMDVCLNRPVIVHYAGCAPWKRECEHPLLDVWIKYNNMLEHPAPRRFATKGWLRLKMLVWDILHPAVDARAVLSRQQIADRINSIK